MESSASDEPHDTRKEASQFARLASLRLLPGSLAAVAAAVAFAAAAGLRTLHAGKGLVMGYDNFLLS